MIALLTHTFPFSLNALNATISAQISAYDVTLQTQLQTHEDEANQATASLATATASVSNAIASVLSRFSTVSPYSTGGAASLSSTPMIQTSATDVLINAASGGTVRVNGGQCQTDLCGLAAQVSQLTDALRQQ